MSTRGEEPRQRGKSGKSPAIPDKVAQFYYTYGLFSSSHPLCILGIAIITILACCYPLIHLPLPGNSPFQIRTTNATENVAGQVFGYVQQVTLRVAVFPWESHLNLGDAFRAPLYETFKLLDIVRNYQDPKSLKTLGHVCLHVESIKRIKAVYRNVLPQYTCLVLSPANLWQQDVQLFGQDESILTTIFNHQNFQKGKTSIAEMVFGMHMVDTGIKRYPFRKRQRIIQYAVTLFLKEYDEEFIEGLREKLYNLYPLHKNETQKTVDNDSDETILIHYPGEINYWPFVPVSIAFVTLFLYYYFSVRKIEIIRSKLGMAFTVVLTVLGSLTMNLGVCFFFGLQLSFQGKEIFPYLTMLVGIENVLILTKSVVSTPLHLDVKIRIAQGLSKEGWSITKNLLLEITILTFGLLTFVPAIQEFCIFAITGLVTDFLMQVLFFSTILGLDICRTDGLEKNNPGFRSSLYQNQSFYDSYYSKSTMSRSKSHPRLSTYPTNVVAGQTHGAEKKIPKRVRFFNIWARTRFFQRAFMILMIIWIGMIAYNSGLIEHYILNYSQSDNETKGDTDARLQRSHFKMLPILNPHKSLINVNYVTHSPLDLGFKENQADDLVKLKHSDFDPGLKLSLTHWSSILSKYNISLSGQSLTVLPSIKLSHVLRPEEAIVLRNPNEKYGETFHWQALAAALDPLEFNTEVKPGKSTVPQSEQPFYPQTPMELFLTTLLCLISVIVLAYIFVVLYRCICSRNYAEWRASWFSEKSEESSGDEQVLLEAIPTALDGHQQEIECLATDGVHFVSSCLGGILKVWDNSTGEVLSFIDRYSYFCGEVKQELNIELEDFGTVSDYESGSPPSRDENTYFPKLLHKINTDFSNLKTNDNHVQPPVGDAKYDFTNAYRQLYLSHEMDGNLRNRIKDMNWLKDTVKSEVRHSFSESNNSPHRQVNVNERRRSSNSDLANYSVRDEQYRVVLNRELSDNSSNGGIGTKLSPIWCMDYLDNLIVIGCADGRLEFWEGTTGQLKCIFEDGSDTGVTCIKIIGSKVVATRLYGTIDFFLLQTYNHGRPIDWHFTCAYRRTHVRTGSAGSFPDHLRKDVHDEMKCSKILSVKAHQQPITCLECEGGSVLSGSQDHTLKVFKLEDGKPLYTLHGHCGPITCLFIDEVNPVTAGSGSQDGMLCLWDLLTGACMYSIQAHDGSATSLAYSASYVISLGTDDRLCVWERFQGHLLNTIHVTQTFSSEMIMLAPHLIVTTRNGSLVIWDVRSGDCVRTIPLGRSPYVFVKRLVLLRDAVLCDYANQLRLVRFPLITHKSD